MYKIVFTKLVQWLLPTWLRFSNATMLVLASNYPLREAYNKCQTYFDAVDYRLQHNYQTCYLQAMLNDAFDSSLRRIRIVDFDAFGKVFLFEEGDAREKFVSEDRPLFVYPDDTGFDFTIQLPVGIVTSASELATMASKMKIYKMAGKQYFIERI